MASEPRSLAHRAGSATMLKCFCVFDMNAADVAGNKHYGTPYFGVGKEQE